MPSHRRHTHPKRRQPQRHQCYTKITLHIFTHSVSLCLTLSGMRETFLTIHIVNPLSFAQMAHPLPLIFPKIFQLMFCTAHAYKDNKIIAKNKENTHSRHVNKCLIYQSAHLEPLNHPFTLCTKNHNTHASIQNITYYNITCNVYTFPPPPAPRILTN